MSRDLGVSSCRSCRIGEQGLYPKIQDQHLPGKIFAKLPDSLAPELLTPEFRNGLGGYAQVSEVVSDANSPFLLLLAPSAWVQQRRKPGPSIYRTTWFVWASPGEIFAPDMPSLDARPLFQATLEYVKNHRINLVTLDTGAYIFLLPRIPTAYVRFFSLKSLTVDLAIDDLFRRCFSPGFCSHGLPARDAYQFQNRFSATALHLCPVGVSRS